MREAAGGEGFSRQICNAAAPRRAMQTILPFGATEVEIPEPFVER